MKPTGPATSSLCHVVLLLGALSLSPAAALARNEQEGPKQSPWRPHAVRPHASSGLPKILSQREYDKLRSKVLSSVGRFLKLAVHQQSGVPFNHVPLDPQTMKPGGWPGPWSAASRPALMMRAWAIGLGDNSRDARLLFPVTRKQLEADLQALGVDPKSVLRVKPKERTAQQRLLLEQARTTARRRDIIRLAEAQITSYEQFNAEFPGFAGYLPWVVIGQRPGKPPLEPAKGWRGKTPALDNGEMMWGLYSTSHRLNELARNEKDPAEKSRLSGLSTRYRAHLQLMADNALKMFLDPAKGLLRGEARLLSGSKKQPENSKYGRAKNYHVNSPYEDELFKLGVIVFAKGITKEQVASIWPRPTRDRASYAGTATPMDYVQGYSNSPHESFGATLAPYRSIEQYRDWLINQEKVRLHDAAAHGMLGPAVAAINPPPAGKTSRQRGRYLGLLGFPGGKRTFSTRNVVSPYGLWLSFVAARLTGDAVAERTVGTWLKQVLDGGRLLSRSGMAESVNVKTGQRAMDMTWDNNLLLALGMAGDTDDVRRYLKHDGLLRRFESLVRNDFRNLPRKPLGSEQPWSVSGPTVGTPF